MVLVILAMCVQIYILAALFLLTIRMITPQPSQIPTSLLHHSYIVKRDLFITSICFFELIFLLIVHIELCLHTPLIVHRAEKRCSKFSDDERINFVSYSVFACVLLSVVRCLAQRYVLERLSEPDVGSMTRVYLIPWTCFVALMCLRLWYQLWHRHELSQTNRMICNQKVQWPTVVVHNNPFTSFLLILAFVTFSLVYNFVTAGEEEQPGFSSDGLFCSHFTSRSRYSLKEANASTKTTVPGQHMKHPQTVLTNESAKTPHSALLETQGSERPAPNINAIPYFTIAVKVQQIHTESNTSRRKYFPGSALDSSAPSSCKSRWRFLCSSIRLYLALTVYFTVLVGCYQCTEYLLVGSFLEDFTPVVFASLIIINSLLRAVQIAFAGTYNEDKKQHVVNWRRSPQTTYDVAV